MHFVSFFVTKFAISICLVIDPSAGCSVILQTEYRLDFFFTKLMSLSDIIGSLLMRMIRKRPNIMSITQTQ